MASGLYINLGGIGSLHEAPNMKLGVYETAFGLAKD